MWMDQLTDTSADTRLSWLLKAFHNNVVVDYDETFSPVIRFELSRDIRTPEITAGNHCYILK